MFGIMPALAPDDRTPVYQQIYVYLRDEIRSGRLAAGARLPSIRETARLLSVGKNTVSTAYAQLVAEGYAESKDRSGIYVAYHTAYADEFAQPAVPRQETAGPEPEPHAGPKYNFFSGPIDTSVFPVRIWKRCLLEALHSPSKDSLGLTGPQGDEELRTELAAYLFQSRGIACNPGQIFITAGTQQSLSYICQFLPLIGETVAMENPGYQGTRTVLRQHGCKLEEIPLDDGGIRVDALYASPSASAVYVTPSHQFPMGMVMPANRRMQLLEWAAARRAWIIEDDYDSEFRYHGHPIPAVKAMDRHGRVIYMGTLSKIFTASARLSYIVVPESLAEPFRARSRLYNQSVPPLIQHAVLGFMREGHFERHVRRMRRLYRVKYDRMLEAIRREMGDKVTVTGHNAGLHLLVQINPPYRDFDHFRNALDAGVLAEPVANHASGDGADYSDTFILAFGALSIEDIEEGIGALAAAWFDGKRPAES